MQDEKTDENNREEGKVSKDMVIKDIVQKHPGSAEIMMQHGLHCVGCPVASAETLEEGARAHGIDADELVKDINKSLEQQKD